MIATNGSENALKLMDQLAQQDASGQFKNAATELRTYIKHLETAAFQDPLTGLGNRRSLDRRMAPADGYSVILFDIDHFKKVNDTYGHDVGDEVLRHISNIIEGDFSWRRTDRRIRWGGEEFLIELPNCGAADAARIAHHVRTAIASKPVDVTDPVTGMPAQITITSSFGIAAHAPHVQESWDQVVKRADLALYAAKGKNEPDGRNRAALTTEADTIVVLPRRNAAYGPPASASLQTLVA